MKCPNCNAETHGTHCEYCGSELPKEPVQKAGCPKCGSTNTTFRRENQGEIRGNNAKQVIHRTVGLCKDCGNTWYADVTDTPKKKRKTWLWVLGWIFLFPVPLTILMLRKKDMKPAVKYGIIAAAWIVYIIIGATGNSDNSADTSTTNNGTNTVETSTVVEDNTADVESEDITESVAEIETEPTLEYFATDETVNNFFVKYNDIANEVIDASKIEKGNIDTKALVYIDDFNMEVVATRTELYVSIGTSPDNEDTQLHDIFTSCIKAMRAEYTDDEIETAWSDIHETGYMVEGYELNDTKITYVPYKELSSGHSNLRIDLVFSIE